MGTITFILNTSLTSIQMFKLMVLFRNKNPNFLSSSLVKNAYRRDKGKIFAYLCIGMINMSCRMGGVVLLEVFTGLPLPDPPYWGNISVRCIDGGIIYLEECACIFHLLLMYCILWLLWCLESHWRLRRSQTICICYLHPLEHWLHPLKLVFKDDTCKHLSSACFTTRGQDGFELDTELVLRLIIPQRYKLGAEGD